MSHTGQKVAIITGGSQGIGASLVAAYRRQGWSVVATARTMKPTGDPDVLTIDGDIAEPATADRIIGAALARFGRIDTLVKIIPNQDPSRRDSRASQCNCIGCAA